MIFFRLCPSYEMHAPVSNHKPVQCEPVFKNMARQSGWGGEGGCNYSAPTKPEWVLYLIAQV